MFAFNMTRQNVYPYCPYHDTNKNGDYFIKNIAPQHYQW